MTVRSARELIVQLLGNLGSQKEVDQYLKHYAGEDAEKLAVIKVGGQILDDEIEELASALTFLRSVGLTPVVVHGAGPQLSRSLEEAGIPTERIDGHRVTTPAVLDVARKVFHRVNLRLVEALDALDTPARPLTSGVIEAERASDERLGLVGERCTVHADALKAALRSGHVPVLPSLGETCEGQILNVNADVVTGAVARALGAHKIVFLTPTGGLLDQRGRILSAINLAEDYEELMAAEWVQGGMRLKVQQIKELLDDLPPSSSVSITRPASLARELFTHKGAGTLLRLGERVLTHPSFDDVDQGRLRELLESCFGRTLDDAYFEKKKPLAVYLAESYRAVAIVIEEEGVPYLDKFAVTREAQGAGVGGSLWHRMRADHPRLFWRARVGNPINTWYFQHADGTFRSDPWVVFWTGLEGFDEVQRCVARALALPATLKGHGTDEEDEEAERTP